MSSKTRWILLIPMVALLGCGSSQQAPPSVGSYLNLNGNWQFQIERLPGAALFSTPIEDLSGSLTSSGSTVTAVLHALPLEVPNCVAATSDISASGTLDTSGNLTLTFPIAGGVGSLSANFTENNTRPILSGTYQVVGGTCAQSATTVTFFQLANVTGTYSGAAQLFQVPIGSGPTSTVTAVLVQSDTPNADGQYPLTGTITMTGACTATLTFNQGIVSGDQLQSYPGSFNPVPPNSFTSSTTAFSNQVLLGGILDQLTGCPGSYIVHVLNRQ
jgi:hypothetical protein